MASLVQYPDRGLSADKVRVEEPQVRTHVADEVGRIEAWGLMKKQIAGGTAGFEHIVQLFDGPESTAEAVAGFVYDGLMAGESVLVVMAPEGWELAAGDLAGRGIDVSGALAGRRLVVRDGARLLRSITRNGVPDAGRFEQTVGALVGDLASSGVRLRVYGEMVDLLASAGDFREAGELEELWNGLGARQPFTLFCGYSAVAFGDPRSAEWLRRICRCHTRVRSSTRDVLGEYLLHETTLAVHPLSSTVS